MPSTVWTMTPQTGDLGGPAKSQLQTVLVDTGVNHWLHRPGMPNGKITVPPGHPPTPAAINAHARPQTSVDRSVRCPFLGFPRRRATHDRTGTLTVAPRHADLAADLETGRYGSRAQPRTWMRGVNGSQTVRRAYSASGGPPITCVWTPHTWAKASRWWAQLTGCAG